MNLDECHLLKKYSDKVKETSLILDKNGRSFCLGSRLAILDKDPESHVCHYYKGKEVDMSEFLLKNRGCFFCMLSNLI